VKYPLSENSSFVFRMERGTPSVISGTFASGKTKVVIGFIEVVKIFSTYLLVVIPTRTKALRISGPSIKMKRLGPKEPNVVA